MKLLFELAPGAERASFALGAHSASLHRDYPLKSASVEQGNRALRFPARLGSQIDGQEEHPSVHVLASCMRAHP